MADVGIESIAKKLNLNKSTVSRALNNKGRVSEKTKKLVREEAAKMKYVVNYNAKNIYRSDDKTVGILIDSVMKNNIYPYILSEKISGISDFFCANGYRVLNICFNTAEDSDEICRYILEKGIRGIISLEPILGDANKTIKNYNFNHVMVNWKETHMKNNEVSVSTDINISIEILINHMIERGYTDIAIINWYKNWWGIDTGKIEEIKVQNPGIKIDIWNTDTDRTRKDIYEYLENNPHRAYISLHYKYGFWILDWLKEHNMKVPQDVAVATHDYNPIMEDIYIPHITGVMQPTRKLAEAAAEKLMNLIENRNCEVKIPDFIFVQGETT